MFDFLNANDEQKKAISHTVGPLLITAGPGTGKTFTLVQRAVYLIQEHHIAPEQIMIATFTEKAAKEIITRITNELMERKISVNINEMYIGTFHSICLRFSITVVKNLKVCYNKNGDGNEKSNTGKSRKRNSGNKKQNAEMLLQQIRVE